MVKEGTKLETLEPGEDPPASSPDEQLMCVLPQENLQAVHDWISSDKMTMPHNEVIKCLRLLEVSRLVKYRSDPDQGGDNDGPT